MLYFLLIEQMTNDFPEISIILYDDLPGSCSDIRHNLLDLTEFKLNGRYRLDITVSNDIDQAISTAADTGREWAVVVTAGNYLQDQTLLLQTIEHAKAQQSPLACHILDRGGYYHFHPQWFALDLRCWHAVGRPRLSEHHGQATIATRETQRSSDNVHDEYTPWWVKPASESTKIYTSDYGYFGLYAIAAFVAAGHPVVNIPHEVRNRKSYCYPHHNHDRLVRVINKESFEIDDVALVWFKKAMDQLVEGLNKGYYVLNTENLNGDDRIRQRNYDCFVGVCGGIKPACIAGQDNFNGQSRVILFDISQAAIDYQKFLLGNWDGDFSKFESVWKEFQGANPDYRPHYFSSHSIEENITWFLDAAGMDRTGFQRLWKRYQQMDHEFVALDLLEEGSADRLVSLIGPSQGAYVWLSNAFSMDYLMFYKTRAWCDDYNRRFVETLKNKSSASITLENCGMLQFLS